MERWKVRIMQKKTGIKLHMVFRFAPDSYRGCALHIGKIKNVIMEKIPGSK
jgi:hypothetical protein